MPNERLFEKAKGFSDLDDGGPFVDRRYRFTPSGARPRYTFVWRVLGCLGCTAFIFYATNHRLFNSIVGTNDSQIVDENDVILPWILGGGQVPPKECYEEVRKGRCHKGTYLNGKKAERLFMTVPNVENSRKTSRSLGSIPRMPSSREDYDTAIDILRTFQTELGINPMNDPVFDAGSKESRSATIGITEQASSDKLRAWIDTYYPILNRPGERSVDLLSSDGEVIWSANLTEDSERRLDPDAEKYASRLPAFQPYSYDGVVEGKLVFANYGRKEDFDVLDRLRVNLTGKIVVARNGINLAGLKVKQAEIRGAVGCLLYNDPRDDGVVNGDNGYAVYPFGPARNPTSYDRSSVQLTSFYPGDPTTPGYPSYNKSKRAEPRNVPKIPSIPISWSNAQRLLQEIELGGQNRTVRVVNRVQIDVAPIWNVMAVIPGYIKDEVVVIGSHRDSLGLGVTDPNSGTTSIIELVRGLGVLLKAGWKPIRSIVIANWDAGQYGLIGSTEWGEDFAPWIQKHVVAYLNVESSGGGSRFSISSTSSLSHLLVQVAKGVPHPVDANRTLWDARTDIGPYVGNIDADSRKAFEPSIHTWVDELGSDSDFTVFQSHLGIASSTGSFQQSLTDAPVPRNSVFDTHTWLGRYGDKGYERHVAMSRFFGIQLLRLADAVVLPLNTTHYANTLSWHLDHVKQLAEKIGVHVDLSSLRQSIQGLQHSSHSLDHEKVDAEKDFNKLVVEWLRLKHQEGWLSGKLKEMIDWIRNRFGCRPHRHREVCQDRDVIEYLPWLGISTSPRIGQPVASSLERQEEDRFVDDVCTYPSQSQRKRYWRRRRKLLKKLGKAAKRIRSVNMKLAKFEQGLTSEDGLMGREWYKHLGVAPGKWQGSLGVTLPGLTEAITLDKNATLARQEVHRLTRVLDRLAKATGIGK